MEPNIPSLTLPRLKDVLSYEPETGIFRWVKPAAGRCKPGDIAGSSVTGGYVRLVIDCEKILAHRVAWFYVHGKWPNEIDHINGVRDDNRIVNLRNTTAAENAQNRCIGRGSSNLIGASWDKRERKWRAAIKYQGRKHHIGYFGSAQDAHAAYLAAKQEVHAYWASEVGASRIKRPVGGAR